MSKITHNIALALVASAKLAPSANLTAFGKVLNDQLALIRSADPEIAKRAICVGTALLMVKQSLEHGQFGPWLQKHIDDLGRRQVNYYMRLALAALESGGVSKDALEALPIGDIEAALVISQGPAARLRESIEVFVGEQSLSDLLADHCGKPKGSGKNKSAAKPVTAEEKEQSVQDRCNEIAELVDAARKGATDKGTWMSFSAKQHRQLRDIFNHAAGAVAGQFVQTHGNGKAGKQ